MYCHQKGVKSLYRKGRFLQFPLFASEGKADKGKECNMAEGTVKILFDV